MCRVENAQEFSGINPIFDYIEGLRDYVNAVTNMSQSDVTTLLGRVQKFLRFIISENGAIDASAAHRFALRSDPKVPFPDYLIHHSSFFNTDYIGRANSIYGAAAKKQCEIVHDL
jgi:hypothetical protein